MADPETPERSSLGREIRRLRLASGMTLPELSALTGIREAYLAAIEDDREEPSAPALERIAQHLQPAGGSFELLAGLLTQAEFNAAGEYPEKGPTSELRASAAEDVWRRKTNVEVLDAARYIDQYTDEGRRAILNELERRDLRVIEGAGQTLAPEAPIANLQFDRAEFAGAVARTPCAICHMPLGDSYYQVNGGAMCTACCDELRKSLNAGSPISRAAWATGAGLLAAVAGTVLYYAILASTGYQLSLISIVVGVGVGKAVNWGSYGRGGWKYQALAMALTYLAIVSSYVPLVVKELKNNKAASATTSAGAAQPGPESGTQSPSGRHLTTPSAQPPAASQPPSFGRALLALVVLFLFICAIPFLTGVSNLVGLAIIGIGVYEAWKFNRRRSIVITGPHALAPSAPAVAAG